MNNAMPGSRLARIQGWFYVLTGLWPLVLGYSFQLITGFKADFWLAQTVGVLLAVTGTVMIAAARAGRVTPEIGWLAAGQAAALAVVDVYCVSQPRTTLAYWLDAPVELAFVLAWVVVWRQRTAARPARAPGGVGTLGIAWLLAGGLAFAGHPQLRAGETSYTLYVSNERSGDVTVLDGVSLTAVRTIPVGKRPRGLHLTPDGRQLLVATSGSPRMGPGVDPERAKSQTVDKSADGIAVVDPATGVVTKRFSVGSDPEEFALSPDGQRLLVANEDIASATLLDAADGRVLATAAVSDEPEGVSWRPDGAVAYVACEQEGEVVAIDSAGAVVGRVALGGRPRTITFTADGRRAYVPLEAGHAVAVIDAHQHRLLSRIEIPGDVYPMGAALSPDGREFYVSTGRGNSVLVIDTGRGAVVGTIAVGQRPWGLKLSPDGKRLFTANGQSDDVSVVDVATRRELNRVKTGAGPWGIAIGPAVSGK
jgi:YVTN family beta-propeller protein